jgi:hypothetical protein
VLLVPSNVNLVEKNLVDFVCLVEVNLVEI